jgi:1-acyl-sn-glycerol-3-phosphate acyltransferase
MGTDPGAYQVPLHNRVLRRIVRPVFRSLFHVLGNVEIIGKENIPKKQPCLIAINHISIYEPPFILAFWPTPPEAAGAIDIWSRRGQSILVRIYGGIPVDRGQYNRKLLETLVSVIHAGRSLVIAPEGGRSHTPGMKRAQPGIAFLAEQTEVPVLPVGIFGSTEDFFAKAKQGKRPTIGMKIGTPFRLPPLEGSGKTIRIARQCNADLVMLKIAGLLPPEYHGVYAEGMPKDATNQIASTDGRI